ncbi:MAG: L-histidine N(alpha)-methyltransferase, partial [Acidobacteriota bacterium]
MGMNKAQNKSVNPAPDLIQDSTARFANAVESGLNQSPKKLPCVYFYDRTGSRIFEQICQQPEYYCTSAETEILNRYATDIAAACENPARIVELGSGSSVKTRILLDAFTKPNKPISYYPIDVSPEILKESSSFLNRTYPSLNVEPIVASYEIGLDKLDNSEGRTLLIWLGSSIGNFEPKSAVAFLQRNCCRLKNGDRILVGIDLIKDPDVLQAAYNDSAGVTAAFNLNLLARINRELGGDFQLEQFEHQAVF